MGSKPCLQRCACKRCKPCTDSCTCGKHRPRKAENAPNWQGDNVSYEALHYRLREQRGRAAEFACDICGGDAHEWAYLGGCPEEKTDPLHGRPFALDMNYYVPMCRPCHRVGDRISPKRRANS